MNRILREIRIFIAKECEKISKMNGEIEVDENYFLLRYTRNCKQKVQSVFVVSVGVGLEKRHLCSEC